MYFCMSPYRPDYIFTLGLTVRGYALRVPSACTLLLADSRCTFPVFFKIPGKHGAWLRIVSVRVPLNSRSFCIKVSLESSDFQMNRFASFLVSNPAAF